MFQKSLGKLKYDLHTFEKSQDMENFMSWSIGLEGFYSIPFSALPKFLSVSTVASLAHILKNCANLSKDVKNVSLVLIFIVLSICSVGHVSFIVVRSDTLFLLTQEIIVKTKKSVFQDCSWIRTYDFLHVFIREF